MTSKDIPNTDERFGNGHGESGWKWEKIEGVEAVGMGGKTAGKNRFLETKAQVMSNISGLIHYQVNLKAGNFDHHKKVDQSKLAEIHNS